MGKADETIQAGDYVLIQRQDYMRLQRVKERSTVKLGQHHISLDAIIGEPYMQLFEMQPNGKNSYKLKKVDKMQDISAIDVRESGRDNRHIVDDGTSQALSKTDIAKLRDENSTTEILEKLVTNSRTFDLKTEYSQEKYLKKKQKKYYGYITIRRPTVRLMAKVFFKQQREMPVTLRLDDLSQILNYANIQSGGKFVLFDSGTNGLLPAAIMARLGADNDGQLVYLYPGNDNQREALHALRLPEEQVNRCIPVNIHSALRWLHQNKTVDGEYVLPEKQQAEFDAKSAAAAAEPGVTLGKRKHGEDDAANEQVAEKRPKRPQWHYQCHSAAAIMRAGVDGIIIASREHPLSVVQEVIGFLKPSRSFAIYHALREPLQDAYFALVGRRDVTNVKLSSNFMRDYQVLPERTHPLVNMTSGGYLLTGVKLVSIG